MKHIIPIFFCMIALVGHGFALDKDFGQWNAYTAHQYLENGKNTCNLYARPHKIDSRRSKAQLNITNRPTKKHRITIHMGRNLHPHSPTTIRIRSKTYTLKNHGMYAFVRPLDTKSVIYHMKMGATLHVKSTDINGTVLQDSYSLVGFTRGLQTIDKYC